MRALIDVSIVGEPPYSPVLVFHTVTTPDGEPMCRDDFEMFVDALAAVIVEIWERASPEMRYGIRERMQRTMERLEAME